MTVPRLKLRETLTFSFCGYGERERGSRGRDDRERVNLISYEEREELKCREVEYNVKKTKVSVPKSFLVNVRHDNKMERIYEKVNNLCSSD